MTTVLDFMPRRSPVLAAAALLSSIGPLTGCDSGTLGPTPAQLEIVVTLSAGEMTPTDTVEVIVRATNPTPYRVGYVPEGCYDLVFELISSGDTRLYPTEPPTCFAVRRFVEFAGHETKERVHRFDVSLAEGGSLPLGTYRVYGKLSDGAATQSEPVELEVIPPPAL